MARKVLGYCNNPNNYFFGEPIDEYLYDTEKEECGMRKCKYCPYFVSIEELEREAEDEARKVIERRLEHGM